MLWYLSSSTTSATCLSASLRSRYCVVCFEHGVAALLERPLHLHNRHQRKERRPGRHAAGRELTAVLHVVRLVLQEDPHLLEPLGLQRTLPLPWEPGGRRGARLRGKQAAQAVDESTA